MFLQCYLPICPKTNRDKNLNMSYLYVLAFKLENEIIAGINELATVKKTADVVRHKTYDISDTPPEYMNNPPQPCKIAVNSVFPS